MTKRKKHGSDLAGTQRHLEDWWLQNVSFPVAARRPASWGYGVEYWPGGRTDSIRALAFEHWAKHGVHQRVEENGVVVSPPRCFDAPCQVLAVALALLEPWVNEGALIERTEIAWLRQAEPRLSISESMRAELLSRAEQLENRPLCRAVENASAGRPKLILAQAIAQHLRSGGFTLREVALFMGAKEDVIRHRYKVEGVRSLSAVVMWQLVEANSFDQSAPAKSCSQTIRSCDGGQAHLSSATFQSCVSAYESRSIPSAPIAS